MEETEHHIALNDSCMEIPSPKDIRHSTVIDLEDSIDEQSSSDHLPREYLFFELLLIEIITIYKHMITN